MKNHFKYGLMLIGIFAITLFAMFPEKNMLIMSGAIVVTFLFTWWCIQTDENINDNE